MCQCLINVICCACQLDVSMFDKCYLLWMSVRCVDV